MTRAPRAAPDNRTTGPSRQAVYRQRKRAELAEYRRVVCPDQTCTKMHHETGLDDCAASYYRSTHPDCPHGQTEGYDLFGCRCPDCRDKTGTEARWKHARDARRAEVVTAALKAEGLDQLATPEIITEVLELWRRHRGDNRRIQIGRHLLAALGTTGARQLTGAVLPAVVAIIDGINTVAPKQKAPEE